MSEFSVKQNVIEANDSIPCAACGRFHRKLIRTNGHWLGSTCREDYKLYQKWPDKTAQVWRGWNKQYDKIHAMVTDKPV